MIRTNVFEFSDARLSSTSGAADIDVTYYKIIIFDTETTFNFASGNTFTVPACYPVGVSDEDSIHVNSAVKYAVM